MKTKNNLFSAVASRTDKDQLIKIDVPVRVFSAQAEQLRWDVLLQGKITFQQWQSLNAFVRPESGGAEKSPRIIVTLTHSSIDPISKSYPISALQGFLLFVQSRITDAVESKVQEMTSVQFKWKQNTDGIGVPVPLAPLRIPADRLMPPQLGSDSHAINIKVTRRARETLDKLCVDTIKRGFEAGGALLGTMTNLNTIEILDVFCATADDATPEKFVFQPRFWLDVNARLAGTDACVIGWCHSHVCEAGFPDTLSTRDLEVFHMHFPAPWSLAALLCASSAQSVTKWFGWSADGNVVQLQPKLSEDPTKTIEGEKPCQRHL